LLHREGDELSLSFLKNAANSATSCCTIKGEVEPKEYQIVIEIYRQWQKRKNYRAIAMRGA
jgi:hypothetical protein